MATRIFLTVGLLFGWLPAYADEVREYGEYLSGECTTCHQIDGTATEGIPPIIGLDPEVFVEVMMTFKNGERDNEAMVSVVKNLDDEQLKALAVYFGSIEPPE